MGESNPGKRFLQREKSERDRLWVELNRLVETYWTEVDSYPVAPSVTPAEARHWAETFDFNRPVEATEALRRVAEGLTRYQLHNAHSRYFGVFNPAPTTMGIAADTLVAAFNPQLASWVSSPLCIEMEQHLLREFGKKFGYAPEAMEGTFTSGGAEANHTAMLTALTYRFPEFSTGGVRALGGLPVWYVSAESHHSFLKAARLCGLGTASARTVALTEELRLDPTALRGQIRRDRNAGHLPFMVVATAGSTSAGIVDCLAEIAAVAAEENLWFHLDAAWGGAACLLPEMKPLFAGADRADSITLDAHKWLSVPMGSGLHLNRHPGILEGTFRVDVSYMYRPDRGREAEVHHPYQESMQWSRRFIGLKLFLSLAAAGWEGYIATLRHQIAMGDSLRTRLSAGGWEVLNRTPLPVACFVDKTRPDGAERSHVEAVARHVARSGKAWVTTTTLHGREQSVLRAGIASYRTEPSDLDALLEALDDARRAQGS